MTADSTDVYRHMLDRLIADFKFMLQSKSLTKPLFIFLRRAAGTTDMLGYRLNRHTTKLDTAYYVDHLLRTPSFPVQGGWYH